jgi:hypothetical protein
MRQRTAGRAGLGSVLLLLPISALLAATDYPFADATTPEVIAYLDDHRTALMMAILVEFVSIGLLLVFVAGISDHLPPSVKAMTLAAGTGTVLLIGLEISTLAAAAFSESSATIDALWPLAHFGLGVLQHLVTALFVASATLGLVRSEGLALDQRLRSGVIVLGVIATLGNAAIPIGYLGESVDFVAGFAEHAIATLPYALWLASYAVAILDLKPSRP